ncbi:MAG TPA: MBL fold metallo-hydrolase [Solirubrobacteraceae bacterium]|jgi:glyoxylase-like metal-dependent hydrolase (beta-lactamase superfamily II)/rhodanese-related sulfurtransferase
MIFRQITHDDLGCASYLIGDDTAGVAAVVDPKFEIDEYLRLARYMGVSIEHVLETHNHADHVSGHGRLAAATGAVIHIHRSAGASYDHEPFDDGWELELGTLRIRAMHTPGHRPEHTAFALIARDRGEEPWALLTGDSLFINDVARPDLAVDKHEGAHTIFRSLHERVLSLPAETEVWPGHLGGSLCGGPGMDMKISSTLAFELAHNELLAEDDEERFVARALYGLGPQPPNFNAIVALNKSEQVTEDVGISPLTPRQVEQRRSRGAVVIDVRTDLQFDDAHIPEAICIPAVQAGFGTRLAWLAARDREIVLVGRDDEDARRASKLALAVGIRKLGGHLAGGMTEWRREQRPVQRIERLDIEELAGRAAADPAVQILDVRERAEHDAGFIPGSAFQPWHDIDALPDGLDAARPIAVLCASGQRAAVAASLVQRHGAGHVIHVVNGGVPKWGRLGHPLRSADAGAG